MTNHDNKAGGDGIRVILSTGIGRLHLVQSALWLKRAGVDIRVIQGWLPLLSERWLQRMGRLIRHPGLVYGMRQRRPAELEGRLAGCAAAEFLQQILSRLVPGRRAHWLIAHGAWRFFGFLSRRYLHDADIFHVRSGAGQGGAIRAARARGMAVVVDQSAVHPAFWERQLNPEYKRLQGERNCDWSGPGNPFWAQVLADCQMADILLVNSDWIRETFINEGYAPERIAVIPLGVRDDFAGIKQDYTCGKPLRLLYTGSLSILKGAEYLLAALALLRQAGRDVVLTAIGANAEARACLLQDGLPPGLTLVGHMPQDTLRQYLAAADVYVLPSLCDGCASAGMEALSAGLPVVATRESGLPIVDGRSGLIVPAKDARALAERIAWLQDHDTERENLGRQARRMMSAYTWSAYADRVCALYAGLLQSVPAAGRGGRVFRFRSLLRAR